MTGNGFRASVRNIHETWLHTVAIDWSSKEIESTKCEYRGACWDYQCHLATAACYVRAWISLSSCTKNIIPVVPLTMTDIKVSIFHRTVSLNDHHQVAIWHLIRTPFRCLASDYPIELCSPFFCRLVRSSKACMLISVQGCVGYMKALNERMLE